MSEGKKGFAAMSKEKQEEARQKSLATRARKAEKKKQDAELSKELRAKAEKKLREAEILQQQADELDGQNSSEKYRKKREQELTDQITERFRGTVSDTYLRQMIAHAVRSNLSVEELVTPSMAAMDILHSPDSSSKEKQDAIKMLQQFENSKPQAKVDEGEDSLGSIQEEMDKLMDVIDHVAPKR